jgi:hypothetical protein
MDKFKVRVSEIVSNENIESSLRMVSVYPNLSNNYVNIIGGQSEYNISIISVDQSFKQEILLTDSKTIIDVSHLENGMYFLLITNQKTRKTQVEKLIKY